MPAARLLRQYEGVADKMKVAHVRDSLQVSVVLEDPVFYKVKDFGSPSQAFEIRKANRR